MAFTTGGWINVQLRSSPTHRTLGRYDGFLGWLCLRGL